MQGSPSWRDGGKSFHEVRTKLRSQPLSNRLQLCDLNSQKHFFPKSNKIEIINMFITQRVKERNDSNWLAHRKSPINVCSHPLSFLLWTAKRKPRSIVQVFKKVSLFWSKCVRLSFGQFLIPGADLQNILFQEPQGPEVTVVEIHQVI